MSAKCGRCAREFSLPCKAFISYSHAEDGALAAALPPRPLTPEERRRFVAGRRESDNEEPLPPRCRALVDLVLGGQR